MIIAGDLAVPEPGHVQLLSGVIENNPQVFAGKNLLCNFEGLLSASEITHNSPVLYNHPDLVNVLAQNGKVALALANNHVLDLPGQFRDTIQAFRHHGVLYTGAGQSRDEALRPMVTEENGKTVVIFNACWDFLLYNQKNPSNGIYVAEINESEMLSTIADYHQNKPDVAIVVYLHWNFDLETLPFPLHRQFARALIDSGARIVAGAHSHCVQGGEAYKNGYIIYGLGNFLIPHGHFAGGKISYPSWSSRELVLEWDPVSGQALCHWFIYTFEKGAHNLFYQETEHFGIGPNLKSYSPFIGMDHRTYVKFFRENRRKRLFIPVYTDYHQHFTNQIKTGYLKYRARFARFLAKNNLIQWQH